MSGHTPHPATLADTLNHYAADRAVQGSTADIAIRRAFMAGALEALTNKAPQEQMLAECMDFALSIGRETESAEGVFAGAGS